MDILPHPFSLAPLLSMQMLERASGCPSSHSMPTLVIHALFPDSKWANAAYPKKLSGNGFPKTSMNCWLFVI